MPRARSFCFTINNYTQKTVDTLAILGEHKSTKYMVYGFEVGEKGTPHIQGYINFKSAKTLSAVVKLGLGHLAIAKGNHQQNRDYCTKDGEFKEFGTLPSPGTRTDLISVRESIRDHRLTFEELVEDHIPVLARYPMLIDKLQAHYHPPEDLPKLDNLWIYGPPGTGKTTHAKSLGSYYIKMPNKWFCGYRQEDHVIVEDIGPDQGKMLQHFLKIWADHSPFTAQTKGSSMLIRPKRIIVTSNYSIEEMGFDEVTTQAIKRRFQEKFMGP